MWHQLYLWLLPFDLNRTVLGAYVQLVFVGQKHSEFIDSE